MSTIKILKYPYDYIDESELEKFINDGYEIVSHTTVVDTNEHDYDIMHWYTLLKKSNN